MERPGLYSATEWLIGYSLVYIWYIAAIAWSSHYHGLLANGDSTADHCIRSWNTLTGHSARRVDTGSQVTNVAWSKDSSELVSFLHIKVNLCFVV
jgi:WD40 repeat protein